MYTLQINTHTHTHISTDIQMQFIKLSDRWQIFGVGITVSIPIFRICHIMPFSCCYYNKKNLWCVFSFGRSVEWNKCKKQTSSKIWQFQWRIKIWCVCALAFRQIFAIKSDYTHRRRNAEMSISAWNAIAQTMQAKYCIQYIEWIFFSRWGLEHFIL